MNRLVDKPDPRKVVQMHEHEAVTIMLLVPKGGCALIHPAFPVFQLPGSILYVHSHHRVADRIEHQTDAKAPLQASDR